MIDWNSAPEGAEYYDYDKPHWYKKCGNTALFFGSDGEWTESMYKIGALDNTRQFTPRPQEWPTDEQRIDANGPSGEHYDTVDWSKAPEDATHWGSAGVGQGNYFWKVQGQRTWYYYIDAWRGYSHSPSPESVKAFIAALTPRPVTATPPANKYDRTIIGKYGTGSCTVDVYRVLNAFGPLSPEIDHSIKKLLAAGDNRQDLLEAIQSIEARLQYLEVRDGD